MSHLHTNVIALSASTKSIQWRKYECNYNNSDASGAPLFLSVCRKLLQAKVPCLWRPLGSSDTASQILSMLHMPDHEGLFGESLHDSASNSSSSSKGPTIQLPDRWEIWVFHALIPMEQALGLVPIPSSFKESVVDSSGEISWKSGSKNVEVEGDDSQQPVDDINGLFNRALDNIIDCALLPLSIVRFGLRQWLSLAELPSDQDQKQQYQIIDSTATSYSHQLPLTPPSPELDIPLGIADFVSASTLLDSDNYPIPAFSSPYSATNASAANKQHPREHKIEACRPLHLLKLSATLAPLQNTLLLQYNSSRVHGFHHMSYLDTILERRRSNGMRRLVTDCIPSSDKTSDSAQLAPIAAVRIAPLGIPAMLVSVPTSNLGDTEDRTIDAWSAALGYPKDFFAGKEEDHVNGKSKLVWITLSKCSEPMLYPRRLVLIDEVMSLMLDSSSRSHSELGEFATTAAATAKGQATAEDQEDNAAEHSPASMEVDQPAASADNLEDELEEGESKEGEYDEEGEIAEPVASIEEAPAQSSAEVPLATAELDTVISGLRSNAPRPLEKSLLDIQRSMAKFQSEIRVKEEEEEKARKKEMAHKNTAAARGPANLTKSTSAKSSSATGASATKKRQRSNTKDEHSNKARRKSAASSTVPPPKSSMSDSSNEDIPLQALVATTSAIPSVGSATQPLTQQTAASAGENAIGTDAANGDIGSLFGDTGMGEEGNGGLGDGVANMGDDMGLGMGLGMDMGMGDNLGDFATGMFGVTDDDFNFFDSVPPQQPKPDTSIALYSQPAIDPASTMDVDTKPHGTFDSEMMSEDPNTPAKAQAAVGGDTGVLEQDRPMQEMDDLFDDGVFDSFFGGQTTTTSVLKQEDASITESAGMFAAQVSSSVEAPGITVKLEPLSIATEVSGGPGPRSLSSPPGATTIASLSDKHSGVADYVANPVSVSTAAASMAADMATPASLKMTPAPSIDLQTPTPTMQSLQNSKGGDSADEHSSVLLATADNSPTTISSNPPGSLSTHSGIVHPAIPEDSEVVYSTSGPNAPPLVSIIKPGQPRVVSGKIKTKGRGSWKAPLAPSTALIPEHYRSVSTPYDNIGKSGRSWLHDAPTPASLDDSGNLQDMMDSHEIQHPAYIEKSLNPVAWLKRVSARHIQKHRMGAGAQSRRASATSPLAPRSSLGSLPSIRKLRGWLASYKAKTMYSRHVVPKHVLDYQRLAGEEAAESPSNANASQSPAGAHAKPESMVSGSANGGDGRSASSRLVFSLSASQTANPKVVSNLQYPVVRGANIKRDIGGLSESAAFLEGSGKQQQQQQQLHQQAAGLPSFTSIINPRKLWKSSAAQMPGSLMPSLSLYDLQHATTGVVIAAGGSDTTTTHPSRQIVVQTNAIESSWVPTWILVSKGLADALVGSQDAHWLRWANSLQLLTCAIKDPLMVVSGGDLVHLANIPNAQFLMSAFLPGGGAVIPAVEDTHVGNLGARIGGLLMLGPNHRDKAFNIIAESADKCEPFGDIFDDEITSRQVDDAARCAFDTWLRQLRQDSNWISTVQMLADWAVGSSLLSCTQSDLLDSQLEVQPAEDSSIVGAAVSTALLSFWYQNAAGDQILTDEHADSDEGGTSTPARGLLTLSRLLALENTSPSSTSKYSGYIVKKRRVLPQPSGIYSSQVNSSNRHPGSSAAAGGNSGSNTSVSLVSSAVSNSTNGSVASNSTPAYAGSIVVPSGPGVIEPLLDVRILVGSYGQEDVAVPSSGAISLKSRDAESIYIKRWRYAQKLASRATHDARVATGEIEETEEGEEREDGEDEAADDTHTEPVEDWPDPDSYMMEAEDALRRVCISTNPVSLRWWSQMQMRPVGASKDVRWVAFVPPFLDPGRSRLVRKSNGNKQTSVPSAGNVGEKEEEEEEKVASVGAPDYVREWCQSSADVSQWYLGDVDSAYQAQHLGVHRPLGLQKVLEGTFTQLTESVLPMASDASADSLEWSARLRYEAERLGHCMAHGWYTNSQLEQQKQSQQDNTADDTPLSAASNNGAASPLSATTLVLYMMVPHSSHTAAWLAISEASTIALRAFEKTLGSLIARTSRGVPSSISTVSSQVPWPAVVVHPLPLDLLSQWYCGGRPRAVPSAQGTAMSVYNRCPEFLSPVPSLLVAPSTPASHFAHTAATTTATATVGTSSKPTMPRTSSSQRENENHHGSSAHGVCDRNEFMAAIASSGTLAAETAQGGATLYQQRNTRVGAAMGSAGVGTERRPFAWHSGYFVRTPPDHMAGNTAVSNSQGVNNRAASSSKSGISLGMAAFAHRAYIISMPNTFPSYNSEGSKDSAFVPATISLSRMSRQCIVLDDPSALVHDANGGGGGGGHQTSMAPVISSPLGTPQQRSTYPTPPQTRFVSGSAAEEDGHHHTQGSHQVTSSSASSLTTPAAHKLDDEVSCELDEVYVSFGCATRGASDPLSFKRKGSAASLSNTSHSSDSGGAICSRLISHPLRPNDQVSTLHCIYSVFGQQSRWIAVCWCDERGEYVEHDVFCDPRQGHDGTMSSAAAARIWIGCLRYQRLFCGYQPLRVVLGQWQGMAQAQALAWHEYAVAWNASRSSSAGVHASQANGILLHVVSIGINPAQGLQLRSNAQGMAMVGSETPANRQFSVILHGQQPRFDYACDAMLVGETLASPCSNTTEASAKGAAWLWTTGYMTLQDHCAAAPAGGRGGGGGIPCLCVQLLSNAQDTHDGAGQKSDDAQRMSLLITRSILRQYHQLAVLRHAEHGFAASGNATGAAGFGGWPASLLPLPVAVINDMQHALASLL